MEAVQRHSIQRLGGEDAYMTVRELDAYARALPCELVPAADLLAELRAVKDPEELEIMIAAQRIAEKALTDILNEIRPGVTEKEIAARLQYLLLHFGAVDYACAVEVNGRLAGGHRGGYWPFTLDITDLLRPQGRNTLWVAVQDPTGTGTQARGKQTLRPGGMFYPAQSGIWQTVWLERVPENYIDTLTVTPDYDARTVTVKVHTSKPGGAVNLWAVVRAGGVTIAEDWGSDEADRDGEVTLNIAEEHFFPWSPDSPFLYDLTVGTTQGEEKDFDTVHSYFALRKWECKEDAKGIRRFFLNGRPILLNGLLDQGYWPQGLYTPPSDAAVERELSEVKALGFNLLRKHAKIEPQRWYYHCDKLGMIVWQDMPSGARGPQWQMHNYFTGEEKHRSAESEANFRKEWKEIIDYLYSFPSIGVWVPFNECWGQFKTQEIVEWTKAYDPSRLVNPASGGNHYLTGDILDTHHYPNPRLTLLDTNRATVLGEYGGIGFVMKGHLWEPDRNWGYIRLNSPKEVTDEYEKYAEMLYKLIGRGFSAGVYTQTTDVEMEVNGLMTYDRKEMKVEPERIRKINQKLCNALSK